MHDETEDQDVGRADFGKGGKSQGDGLRHHEIHEDEAGGFHSKHTHPDGAVEHDDHATYDEARDHMDSKFDHEEPDGDEGDGSSDMDSDDIAGGYGRAAGSDED